MNKFFKNEGPLVPL